MKTKKIALVCVSMLTSGMLLTSAPLIKAFAETSMSSSSSTGSTDENAGAEQTPEASASDDPEKVEQTTGDDKKADEPEYQHQVSKEDYEKAKALIEKGETYFPTIRASVTHTQMDAINWARSLIGQSIDVDNGPANASHYQCVDVTMAYAKYLFGNGYTIYGDAWQYSQLPLDGFTRHQGVNPQPGDIVVWTGGEAGHVGVVIETSGETFTTVEQNVNDNPTVQRYQRDKNGLSDRYGRHMPYWGVQRPSYRIDGVPNISNAVYRLYNANNGDHYYTANHSEAQGLVNQGLQYDGIFFYRTPSGGTPIYMLYNPYSGEHFITASANEARSLSNVGWKNQGVAWRAPNSGAPVYRLYNPNPKGFHFWTTSVPERDSLVRAGWNYEGVAFYG